MRRLSPWRALLVALAACSACSGTPAADGSSEVDASFDGPPEEAAAADATVLEAPDDDAAAAGSGSCLVCVAAATQLKASCPTSGACVMQLSTSLTDAGVSLVENTCYENGVTSSESGLADASTPGSVVFRVAKDGAPCFTEELDLDPEPGLDRVVDVTIRDATGAVVSVTSVDPQGVLRFTCGMNYPGTVPGPCPELPVDDVPCTSGACGAAGP